MQAEGKDKDQLDLWIREHEEEFLDDLASLIRIPSVALDGEGTAPFGPECDRVLKQMISIGEKYGFESDNCDGYCGSLTADPSEGHTAETAAKLTPFEEAEEDSESFSAGDIADASYATGNLSEHAHAPLSIGIWGHLDVVEAGEGWIYPPYEMTHTGDFLIGRGVQDDKGPTLAALYAIRYLKETKSLDAKLQLMFGVNEERGMSDVEYYLEHRDAPNLSFVPDSAFPVGHGEKGICQLLVQSNKLSGKILNLSSGTSALNIVPGRASALTQGDDGEVETVVQGVSGHAAYPKGTVNAIGLLAEELKGIVTDVNEKIAVDFLAQFASDGYGRGVGIACHDDVSGELTCNAANLSFEDGIISFGLDVRYPITMSSEEVIETLTRKVAAFGWTVTVEMDSPPNYVEKDHPLVAELMQVYREETGLDDEPYVMGGGTYARKIPNAVVYGPAMSFDFSELNLPEGHGSIHGKDEVQSLDVLKLAIRIYARAIERLSHVEFT